MPDAFRPNGAAESTFPTWEEPNVAQAFVSISVLVGPEISADVARAALFLLVGGIEKEGEPRAPTLQLLSVAEAVHRRRRGRVPRWIATIRADALAGRLGPPDAVRRGLAAIREVAELYDEDAVRRYMQRHMILAAVAEA